MPCRRSGGSKVQRAFFQGLLSCQHFIIEPLQNSAVQDLQLVTLYAHVSESNTASVQVLEKNGFKYVGKFRKAFFVDGSYKDFLIFDWVSNWSDPF
ncbi:GNAT family N-acetyltransferase [bacterium]|nr:GNAT family N-acetyltransferase [bacterium]